MVKVTRSGGVLMVCLLAVLLSMVGGCEWVVSQETVDLSGFSQFEYRGLRVEPLAITIDEHDGTYSVQVWYHQNWDTEPGYAFDLTADEVDTMKSVSSHVIQEEIAAIGEELLQPAGNSYGSFRWDDLELSGTVRGTRRFGTHMYIGEDSAIEVFDFLADVLQSHGVPWP